VPGEEGQDGERRQRHQRQDGQSSELGQPAGGPWFQWHYDRWELPPDARETARNEAASQAFVLRRNLALQFHPELTGDMLEGWLATGGDAVRAYGLDPATLLERTRSVDDRSRERAHRLVDGFLDAVARSPLETH